MINHHKQVIQKKRINLLKRALDFLINSEPPLTLNGKLQKKIDFGPSQIINAMKHVATPEEILDNIPLKETSIFYKENNKYTPSINDAKKIRSDRLFDINKYESNSKNPDILELNTSLQTLTEQKELLQEEVNHLKSVITQAEIHEDIFYGNQDNKPKVYIDRESTKDILKKLLILLSKEELIEIAKKHNSAPHQVFLKSLGERSLIGSLNEIIEQTGLILEKNDYDELIFKKDED